ncbi:MAG: Hydrolase [Caulobacter sp.]|nr:Hydrolase [Caulobacter sp.]
MTDLVTYIFQGHDGASLAGYRALPDGEERGVVQIAHGMAEHFARYAHLTETLTAAGWAVYGNDHRGHGASAHVHGLGSFGPGGFQGLVDDMAKLSERARAEHPGKPLVLLGHSMGSFAAQLYLLEHSEWLAGLVLSGTAALDALQATMIAAAQKAAAAPEGGTLQGFNGRFAEQGSTGFEWLSRDQAQVDLYVADRLCGFELEEAAMASMQAFGGKGHRDPALAKVRKDLPIYIISGEHDPVVGEGLAHVNALIDSYRAAGLSDVEHRVYAEGRHEMFNEVNRDEVEGELVAWLGRVGG